MNFTAHQKETIILDPGNNGARKAIPSEIRRDPLTGRSARICHFTKLQWEKPDFEKLVAGTEKICPFCPDKVLQITPGFPEEILPEGRLFADDMILFPNIAQGLTCAMRAYDRLGIYSFNMNFFTGRQGDDHFRFHLLFSPRNFFNQALGTPDIGALRNLYNETLCMAFPEDITRSLRPYYAK